MAGVGVLIGSAIVYTGVKGTIQRSSITIGDQAAGNSSYLPGKVVAIIVCLCVVLVVVVVAYTILTDS
jgi:hypothetical protein